jgi:DNA-binding FadR family transcriptional regulator
MFRLGQYPPDGGSLVQRAMQAVTDHIRDEGLRVGDTLPGEVHFAAQLGVSRPVLREAFGALAALGLIDVGNGRKARVAALDGAVIAASLGHAVNTAQASLVDVWDVRRTIELRTAELAAVSRTDAEAAEITALADAIAAQSDDVEGMSRRDIAFHEAIARASHNPLFQQIVASFGPLMAVAVPTAWHSHVGQTNRADMIDRHYAVARAIAERDPAAARTAMDAHFDASVGQVLRGLSPTSVR